MKIKKEYILIIIAVLLACTSAVTLAYFSTKIIGSPSGESGVSTGTFEVNVSDDVVSVSDLGPIYDEYYEVQAYKKQFTVSNLESSTLNACTVLFLDISNISETLKSDYFKYKLVSNGEVVSENTFKNATSTEDFKISTPTFLTPNTSKTYTLYIWISYDDTNLQNDLLSTSLTAKIKALGEDVKLENDCINLVNK